MPGLNRSKIELRKTEDPAASRWYSYYDDIHRGKAQPAGYMEAKGVRKLLLAELARKQGSISNRRPAARHKFLDNGVGGHGYKFPSQNFINSIGQDDYGPWYKCCGHDCSHVFPPFGGGVYLRFSVLSRSSIIDALTHGHSSLDSRPTALPPGVHADIYKHKKKASSLFEHINFKKGGIPTGDGCGGTSADEWMSGM